MTHGYFETMGIRFVAGRDFAERGLRALAISEKSEERTSPKQSICDVTEL
jgi:hypothetical protein